MKKMKRLVGIAILSGMGFALLHRLQKGGAEQVTPLTPDSASCSPEKAMIQEWTKLLTSDARVYTGMFNSLQRTADGSVKNPEKIIREWCSRTSYKWPESTAARLCREYLIPAAETANRETCIKYAGLLLQAVGNAGITSEQKQELVLDDTTVMAYTEWNSQELYTECCVKIVTPAWYQNGTVIERGIAVLC